MRRWRNGGRAPAAAVGPVPATPEPGGWRRTFAALRVRNFRLFWCGQLLSLSGTWMQTVGQAWLVLDLTGSPLALGTVTMLQFLPILLFALIAGVFADRVPKRRFLLLTQSAAMLQALSLALLVATGTVQLWHVYVLAFLLGLTNAFDNPTRQAFVPEMVGRELVPNAVALNSSLFNSARIVGPAVGGVTIATVGIAGTFFLNAASFLPVLAALLLMRPAELYPAPPARDARVLAQLREGLGYAFRTPAVLLIVLLMGVLGTFGYNFNVALALLARYTLHAESVGFGFMTSAMGLGSLASAVALAYSGRATERRLLAGAAAFSVLLVLVGLSRWYPLTLLLLVCLGYASITFTATANSRLQMAAPDHLRGRVMSLYFLLFAGSTPIGSELLGFTAHALGVSAAIVIFGSVCAAGVGLALLYRRSVTAAAGA
ncbi:MAG TPA: MFS transporter [Dehalococcoidia bacterium]